MKNYYYRREVKLILLLVVAFTACTFGYTDEISSYQIEDDQISYFNRSFIPLEEEEKLGCDFIGNSPIWKLVFFKIDTIGNVEEIMTVEEPIYGRQYFSFDRRRVVFALKTSNSELHSYYLINGDTGHIKYLFSISSTSVITDSTATYFIFKSSSIIDRELKKVTFYFKVIRLDDLSLYDSFSWDVNGAFLTGTYLLRDLNDDKIIRIIYAEEGLLYDVCVYCLKEKKYIIERKDAFLNGDGIQLEFFPEQYGMYTETDTK